MRRRNIEPVISVPKKTSDARIAITLMTSEGDRDFVFVVPNFLTNTISSQRTEKAMRETFAKGLQAAFGGHVRIE